MKILCKIGLHNYTKPRVITNFSSNVEDWSKKCKRCGKKKSWVKHKKY